MNQNQSNSLSSKEKKMNNRIYLDDVQGLYNLAEACTYKVINRTINNVCKASGHSNFNTLCKLESLRIDIKRCEGDGMALVHDGLVFLLDNATGVDTSSPYIDLDKLVKVKTKKYDTKAKTFVCKEYPLKQALCKHIAKSINGKSHTSDARCVGYVEDLDTLSFDNLIYNVWYTEQHECVYGNEYENCLKVIEDTEFYSRLSPNMRAVIEFLGSGCTQSEIADKTGINLGTVKTAINCIRKQANKRLKELSGGES